MIDIKKTYTTRDGRPVRLLCVDGNHPTYKVVGFIEGDWSASRWDKDGHCYEPAARYGSDLIEVKPKVVVERWINIYQYYNGAVGVSMFTYKQLATTLEYDDKTVLLARAVPFKWVEGEEV